ncbi:hemolysin III family protein [Streptomyces sp. Z26]|uniref:PAQR family membrane homeostasis protein TrhA n=1 Tax=Streptomyces TaxID=1883 RepID=UPI0026AAEC2B
MERSRGAAGEADVAGAAVPGARTGGEGVYEEGAYAEAVREERRDDTADAGGGPHLPHVPQLTPIKPRLRGWLHAGMFPAALVSGVFLTALADTAAGRLACAVYTLTACMLFGISALYHRGDWSPGVNAVLRRLDHANIFLIIAGSYTPLTILLLSGNSRNLLLWGVWIAALFGIAFRVLWVGAPRWLYTPCYIAMGWAAVFFLPEFLRNGGAVVLALVVAGGLLYSVGGVVYALKRPNPSPRWFGFHEVFHSLTLAAFAAHYVGISMVAYG